MTATNPTDRELMAAAIPAWRVWLGSGLSLVGSLLAYQWGYVAGYRAATGAANIRAEQGVVTVNSGWPTERGLNEQTADAVAHVDGPCQPERMNLR